MVYLNVKVLSRGNPSIKKSEDIREHKFIEKSSIVVDNIDYDSSIEQNIGELKIEQGFL